MRERERLVDHSCIILDRKYILTLCMAHNAYELNFLKGKESLKLIL